MESVNRADEGRAEEAERDLKGKGVRMSYTLTIDEPSVASYVTRRGPQFRDEFKALLVAYVQARMAYEQKDVPKRDSGLDLFHRLRANAPLLDDEEMRLFDRAKDVGREVELA